jgi:nitrogen regulatory protein P-II 1
MKKIDAIIKPFELDAIKEAFCSLGIQGMTITEVKVPGENRKHSGSLKRADYPMELIPKLKIEIIVSDSIVEKAVEMINESVNMHSDKHDFILISHIEEAVRIRTAQKGEDAIT